MHHFIYCIHVLTFSTNYILLKLWIDNASMRNKILHFNIYINIYKYIYIYIYIYIYPYYTAYVSDIQYVWHGFKPRPEYFNRIYKNDWL